MASSRKTVDIRIKLLDDTPRYITLQLNEESKIDISDLKAQVREALRERSLEARANFDIFGNFKIIYSGKEVETQFGKILTPKSNDHYREYDFECSLDIVQYASDRTPITAETKSTSSATLERAQQKQRELAAITHPDPRLYMLIQRICKEIVGRKIAEKGTAHYQKAINICDHILRCLREINFTLPDTREHYQKLSKEWTSTDQDVYKAINGKTGTFSWGMPGFRQEESEDITMLKKIIEDITNNRATLSIPTTTTASSMTMTTTTTTVRPTITTPTSSTSSLTPAISMQDLQQASFFKQEKKDPVKTITPQGPK